MATDQPETMPAGTRAAIADAAALLRTYERHHREEARRATHMGRPSDASRERQHKAERNGEMAARLEALLGQ